HLLSVDSPPLPLSTGGRFSLAVPLAAPQVVEVSLQSRPLPAGQRGAAVAAEGQPQPAASGSSAGGQRGGGGPQNGGGAAGASTTFSLSRISDSRAPPSLLVSREWAQAVDGVCSTAASGAPLVLAVLGAKGMGKSCLARLTANRLLDGQPPTAAVAFLDTDVGQPEFTPPGMLSLHLLRPGAPAAVELPLKLSQSAAILEVVHSAVGLVRSPVMITGMQVASRLWVLWGIINLAPAEATGGSVPLGGLAVGGHPLALSLATLLAAWGITEVVRYSFFAV
ncbi:3-hydroxyacyl-CoA dehydratase PASTICCINO 2, partial [Tetrabaena socialis]